MNDITKPPTEIEIAETLNCLNRLIPLHPDLYVTHYHDVVRRLAFQRDQLQNEVKQLKKLLNKNDPVRCKSCGQIREMSEVICGQCGEKLEKECIK